MKLSTKEKSASLRGRRSCEGKNASARARCRSIGVVLALAVVAAAALALSGRASAADTWSPIGNVAVTVNAADGLVHSPRWVDFRITLDGSESNKTIYVSDSPERTEEGEPAGATEDVCSGFEDHSYPASGHEGCTLDIQDFQLGVPHYWWVTYTNDDGAIQMSKVSSFKLVVKRTVAETPTSVMTRADASKLRSSASFDGLASVHDTTLSNLVYKTLESLGSAKMLAVACWDDTDWESVVTHEEMRASDGNSTLEGFWTPKQPRWLHIAPAICTDVQKLIDTHKVNGRRAAALSVVIHESLHAHGVTNEAQTDCFAVQLAPSFALELGMKPASASYLGKLAVRYIRATAPSNYWNAHACRDGGAWDLAPGQRNLDV
jgi:hypothetical protein